MAAIITQEFRRRTARLMLSEIRQEINKNNSGIGIPYYVGIGKSDKWDEAEGTSYSIPIPTGTASEQNEILSNLITLIKVLPKNAGLVIPNVKYKSGSYFKEYDPSDESCFYPDLLEGGFTHNPCYTINNNRIYLCLRAGENGTSVSEEAPVSVGTGAFAESKSDGYVWILIDEISEIDYDIINSDQFITTSRLEDKTEQLIQVSSSASTGNLLYGFSVLNGGKDYNGGAVVPSTIPFKYYKEDLTTGSVDCPVTYNSSTGEIVSVRLPSTWDYADISSKNIVNGYFDFGAYATGSGAVIVARIAPTLGFYYNSANILPTWYISVSVAAVDSIEQDGLYIPYRQISLIRDPEYNEELTTTESEPATLAALYYIELTQEQVIPTDLLTGDILKFPNNTAVIYDGYAFIDGQRRIYFHQNDKSGYGIIPFGSTTGQISYTKSGVIINVAYQLVAANEYNSRTGEVVFTESRSKIERAKSQTEEIKIIIQF